MIMKDLETRDDLELLLGEFYQVATEDDEIGHHFVDLDLSTHLPKIVNFWEKILFGKPLYFGNPLIVHKILNEQSPLLLEHFDRWVEIFNEMVDRYFEGEMADAAKLRAKMIAGSLGKRINESPVI